MIAKRPIVAVLGSGSPIAPARADLARAVGAMVASLGAHLLTGAGFGVMAAAAEGFVGAPDRVGLSLGMVPCAADGPLDAPNRAPDGRPYPNPFVEIAVFTALPPRVEDWTRQPSRNHVNVLTADALVALPGTAGTLNELAIADYFRGEHSRPPGERRTVLLGPEDEFPAEVRAAFERVDTVAAARDHVAAILIRESFALPGASS